jgi:hypothetical protein
LSNLELVTFILVLLGYDALVLGIWAGFDGPTMKLEESDIEDNTLVYRCSCSVLPLWVVLLIIPKVILLAWGAYLAYQVTLSILNLSWML